MTQMCKGMRRLLLARGELPEDDSLHEVHGSAGDIAAILAKTNTPPEDPVARRKWQVDLVRLLKGTFPSGEQQATYTHSALTRFVCRYAQSQVPEEAAEALCTDIVSEGTRVSQRDAKAYIREFGQY